MTAQVALSSKIVFRIIFLILKSCACFKKGCHQDRETRKIVIVLLVSMDEFLLQTEFSASLNFFIFQRRMLLVLTASSAVVGKVLCIEEI